MDRDSTFSGPLADPTLFARMSRLVNTSRSIDEILQGILEESVRICNAARGFLALVDHDRGELDARYTAGDGWTEEKRLARLKVSEETGRGITSHVAATGKLYRSNNVLRDAYYIMSFEDVRSEVAVPLSDTFGRTRGVINVESVAENAFGEADERALQGLADLGAVAITVFDHRAREDALVQIGQELNGISDENAILRKVIDVAADVLKFEDCSLFLMDPVTEKLMLRASRGPLAKMVDQAAYDVGEGLTGWTVEHQEPVRLSQPNKDPRWKGRFEELPAREVGAFMAVPIHSRRGALGVLRVQRRKSPYKWFANDFTEDDARVLATIAAQLGIALDNARLMRQLVRSERMAAWGEMSARSAHMIGNRVFAIKGDLNELEYLFEQGAVEPMEAGKLLESVKKGIFLLEEILNEFREFVKATQLDTEEVDINDLVREAVDEGFPKRSQTHLKLRLSRRLPKIKADSKKLKRCFSELMENSVSFQPEGGSISVSTSLAGESSKKWLDPARQHESFIQIRFEDTGPGIDRADKPKIFNAFYTSRAKGMGLGLSIVKGIVEAHNGIIFESGRPGKGAKFTILLPFDPSPQQPAKTTRKEEARS